MKKPGIYGGQIEIVALCKIYHLNYRNFLKSQVEGAIQCVDSCISDPTRPTINLLNDRKKNAEPHYDLLLPVNCVPPDD